MYIYSFKTKTNQLISTINSNSKMFVLPYCTLFIYKIKVFDTRMNKLFMDQGDSH